MIRERFILATLCSASIGLVADGGLAFELETARHRSEGEKATIASKNAYPGQKAGNWDRLARIHHGTVNSINDRTANFLLSQSSLEEEIESPTNTSEVAEPSEAIDRRLALIAMAVTLIISLLLTINLFRRPKRKIAAELTVLEQSNCLEETREQPVENKQIAPSRLRSALHSQEVTELDKSFEANRKFRNEALPPAKLPESPPDLVNIDVVAELISDLQQSDRQLRRKAIWELAERGDTRSLKPLIDILPYVSPLDKSLVNKAVTQIVYRSFQPINDRLFTKLQSRNPEIRKNAIRDLRDLYMFIAPVTKKLAQMQQDADRGVSQTATQALQQLNFGFSAQKSDNSHVHRPNSLAILQEDQTIGQLAALLSELDDEK